MQAIDFPTGNSVLISALNKLRQASPSGVRFNYNDSNSYPYFTDELGMCLLGNFFSELDTPGFYHFKGTYNRIYFRFFEGIRNAANVARAGRSSQNWVSYYDIDNSVFGGRTVLPASWPASTDYHNTATLCVANNGHIVAVQEELKNPGVHNSNLQIFRSDNPEDITSFTLIATIATGEFAYPLLKKTSDGNLYILCRNKVGGDENRLVIFKSVNNGLNWTDLQGNANTFSTVAALTDLAGYYLYKYNILCNESEGLNIAVIAHQGVGSYGRRLHHLQSYDGITWNNVRNYLSPGNGYSRNILTGGVLTGADLNTNYLVDSIPAGSTDGLFSRSGTMNKIDKTVYHSYGIYDSTKANQDRIIHWYLARYDYNTDTWVRTEIKDILSRDSTYSDEYLLNSYNYFYSYGDGCLDMYAIGIKKDNPLIGFEPVLSSGNLVPGLYYRVITTTLNYYGTGVVAGNIIRATAATAITATDTVRRIKPVLQIFRSKDYGVNWQIVKEFENFNYNGVPNALGLSNNCYENDDSAFICYSNQKSKAGTLVEYSDLVFVKC